MKFPLYIAGRYFFSKKNKNVINIISAISMLGVAGCTMALIVILSVFNGFDKYIKSMFSNFDPDFSITVKEGKTFTPDHRFEKIKNLSEVKNYCQVLEENVLLQYNDRQYIATIKGVEDVFPEMNEIENHITEGEFSLVRNSTYYAVVGYSIAYYLTLNVNYINPLKIWVPNHNEKLNFDNVENSFTRKIIYPSGIFAIQDYDTKYVIVPIAFARELLSYKQEVTSVEIEIKDKKKIDKIQKEIIKLCGKDFIVKNRFQQHEFFYKIMKSEKWAIFIILSFILAIASFNIIGSITMLIIDKKSDIITLTNLGANQKTIKTIFFAEGLMISVIGALFGLILGAGICVLQQEFELIKFPTGAFVVSAYPVHMLLTDFVAVLLIVLTIGGLASYAPVKILIRKYLSA